MNFNKFCYNLVRPGISIYGVSPLRKINSYPEQEPFSDIGKIYYVEAQKLSAGIEGENFSYGDDTYQEVAVFSSANPSGNIVAFMHGGAWVIGY